MGKRQRIKKERKDRNKEKEKIMEENIHKITKVEGTDEWKDGFTGNTKKGNTVMFNKK
jgi:hypothetical protein